MATLAKRGASDREETKAEGLCSSGESEAPPQTPLAANPGKLNYANGTKADGNIFTWVDIHCSIRLGAGAVLRQQVKPSGPGKSHTLEILRGVSGTAESSELVAVVGPSGAGKSCLLDILAGRKNVGTLSGSRRLNGKRVSQDHMKTVSSYVTQEDAFHPTQTVLDVVMFQAQLRLAASMPTSRKVYLARQLVQVAGLEPKENCWVGGTLPGGIMIRGLSGGEKRRLSLCCGTITKPDLLFADEPTSGLDSLAALMIMKLLRDFCDHGMIVLSTIHQPRQAIWSLFDKVLVLARGYCIFYGAATEAEHWFENHLSLQRPPKTPPADFIIDQVNIDFDKAELYRCTDHPMSTLHDLKAAADLFRSHAEQSLFQALLEEGQHSQRRAGGSGEPKYEGAGKVPDLVFVAHFSYVHTVFSHLLPYNLDFPFEPSWWMRLCSPLFALLFLLAPLGKRLGLSSCIVTEKWDFHSKTRLGNEEAEPLHTQVWGTWYAGWQYLPWSPYLDHVREQLNDMVRAADRAGIKYLGLGSLNKAEWVNHGGMDIKTAVDPKVTRIVHGNTMTAAAVCGNVMQIVEGKQLQRRVFLTGATSKVGRAVALHLATQGYEVFCFTSSPERFAKIQAELPSTAPGRLVATDKLQDGADVQVWLIGKFQPVVNKHVPLGGDAVVFSVPDPMDHAKRPDLHITEGAVFELQAGTYSRRRNPLMLAGRYVHACHAGLLTHASNQWEHHEVGDVDWTSLDRHLAAAAELGLRLPPMGCDLAGRRPPSWVTQFKVLLARNFRSYIRSPGNVLARLVVVTLIAAIAGLVYLHLGRDTDVDAMSSLMGCIFWSCFVISLLPYTSQSNFLYDRSFFQGENAAGLYACSAYYLSNVVLELLINSVNGAVFAFILYECVDFQAFVHAESAVVSAVGFVGIMVVLNLVANAQVLFMTLASPNQEVAFIVAAAYTTVSVLTAGGFVAFPDIFRGVRWVQYLSMIKYPFQALLLHFFQNNERAVVVPGWKAEDVLTRRQLDRPGTVGANLAASGVMYVVFIFFGFLCLRFLYKERR